MRITIFGDPLIELPHVDSYIARVKSPVQPIERAHINEKWPRFPASGAVGKAGCVLRILLANDDCSSWVFSERFATDYLSGAVRPGLRAAAKDA